MDPLAIFWVLTNSSYLGKYSFGSLFDDAHRIRELLKIFRATKKIPKPKTAGLNANWINSLIKIISVWHSILRLLFIGDEPSIGIYSIRKSDY